ncbi:HK97 gp10 family phage protein [Peptostreptococcus porci]|uniref:HK97 gp10 family phage protein n=1 Tax=Peptostreptococcus porci TaxID=2652282 RepID=UPI002A7F9900|nr:HK97 gp10 family phage protein [Peptostreptococcus porci]MDY4128696.1 HK97 gp10 family phage protein [Peptostreptococcus porci]
MSLWLVIKLGLEIRIGKIMEEYSSEVRNVIKEELASTIKDVLKNLEKDSPKLTGAYSKGWKSKPTKNAINNIEYKIYNEKGQLTHLLEYGHLTRNGIGRTRAIPHIKKNEERGIALLEKNISRRLGK